MEPMKVRRAMADPHRFFNIPTKYVIHESQIIAEECPCGAVFIRVVGWPSTMAERDRHRQACQDWKLWLTVIAAEEEEEPEVPVAVPTARPRLVA